MKHLLFILLTLSLALSFRHTSAFHKAKDAVKGHFDNSTYQGFTANKKLMALENAIFEDISPGSWPNALQQAELFIEGMDKSFDFKGDDFPKQGPFDFETRKKLIHSVGAVLKVEYVAVNFTYTGAFQGCKNALLRFSLATAANPSGGNEAMTPGIAYKCLRNYVPSGNIFAMYSLVGQSSFNFFAHDLSSHVPELPQDAGTALQLVRKKFQSVSDFPPFLGKTGLAEYDENGRAPSRLAFPFRLHFHPNTTLHKSIPDGYTGVEFYDQIRKVVSINQHLYSVYAQETPFSDQLTLIGNLYARSVPTTSHFADKSLFFQHTKFETDLVTYPNWEKKARDIMADQRSINSPGYHYPDLSW